VQNAVYNVDYGHLKSLYLARESKTFCTESPYFCLETDFMPAFKLIMHSHKIVSLMQFQANAYSFYNIAK